jgi:signal transduction histidine kinase
MVIERVGDTASLVLETNHPITERKRMEESLRQQADELRAANRSKDEFLAMLAHELRNPLAPLSNAMEIVRNPSAPEALIHRARDIMGRRIQNMERLVNDLLDVSRLTQGRIRLRRELLDLSTVVERAVETSRPNIQQRGQEVRVSMPPEPVYLHADAFRLEQIVGNLLNNASKFTGRGGALSATVEGPVAGREEIVIRVKDSGVGIASEQLPRIFNLFTQVDTSLNRATGGLGIGLTLVRHLVELHGEAWRPTVLGWGRGASSSCAYRRPSARPRRAGKRFRRLLRARERPPGESW